MTQEDRKLLLIDLSARLPYHVRVKVWLKDGTTEEGALDLEHNYGDVLRDAFYYKEIVDIKPYLRPMSSMTEEECLELSKIKPIYDEVEAWKYIKTPIPLYIANVEQFEFFNSHHLDWRNLIPKGLALAAPSGMYK